MDRIASYAEDMIARLPTQFRDKDSWIKLCQALGVEPDRLEGELWNEIAQRNVDTASGAYLDLWGKVVGQERGPRTDPAYRLAIKGRLLANRSSGTAPELQQVITLLGSDSTVDEFFPASILLYVLTTPALPFELARTALRMRAAGVKLFFEYPVGAEPFILGSSDPGGYGSTLGNNLSDAEEHITVAGPFGELTAIISS